MSTVGPIFVAWIFLLVADRPTLCSLLHRWIRPPRQQLLDVVPQESFEDRVTWRQSCVTAGARGVSVDSLDIGQTSVFWRGWKLMLPSHSDPMQTRKCPDTPTLGITRSISVWRPI